MTLRTWLSYHLGALVMREAVDSNRPAFWVLLTTAIHLGGLVAFTYLVQLPLGFAPVVLVLLLALSWLASHSRRQFAIETLAPMFFLYAMIAGRFIFVRAFGGNVPGYFDYDLPDLRSTFFRLEPWAIGAIGYTLAIQISLVFRFRFQVSGITRGLAIVLMLVTFLWAIMAYVGGRTYGVTGTDPFAYAQMGIDLATRGTSLHRFALFPSIAALHIAWSPIVHTGYHIPINSSGDAPTVWPIGGSFAFAIAYRFLGEQGLYLVSPLTSLLLLVVVGWLTWELFCDSEYRIWMVALAVAILATSHTLFDWATVPMVDSQAALFSALAIGLSWRIAQRRGNPQVEILFSVLCGLSLGAAYFVRHTQVLIAPAIFVLLWFNKAPRQVRVRALVITAIGALFVDAFDLWYHQQAFGGLFNVESTELSLFSLGAVMATTQSIFTQLFAAYEFGWLLPFLIYGAYRLLREKQVVFIALSLWFLIIVAFHLPYLALRLRDLLPEFVPLVMVTAYGIVTMVAELFHYAERSEAPYSRQLVVALSLIVAFWLLLIRVWNVVPLAWSEPQRSYGYVTAEQRASFAEIAKLVPPGGLVGSSLNTGAIELYAQRDTFHLGMWSASEQDIFIGAMFREGRAIYLLEDGDEMRQVRNALWSRYTVQYVEIINAPYFGSVGAMSGVLWKITE